MTYETGSSYHHQAYGAAAASTTNGQGAESGCSGTIQSQAGVAGILDDYSGIASQPQATGETDWEATQAIQSQEPDTLASNLPPPLPLPPLPPVEEHWATLIPDTANSACPRIELKGTREKVRHVIGRRPKYPNKRRELVDTNTIIKHTIVSGLHCTLWREWDPDAPGDPSLAIAYLEDHSTNGTFVNGVKVKKEKIVVGDGDNISLGQIVGNKDVDSEFRWRFQLEYAKSERSQRKNPQEAGGLFLKYDIRGQIGSGSFAKVHRAVCKKTGEWSAVKIIDKKRFKHNSKTMFMLQREVTIMKALDNPYIVKYYEGFEDQDTLWLIMEYVAGGDLLDFVINKGGLDEYEASDVALQVCEAMSYLHQQGVAHRDLKPENILMTKGPQPRCKIADFGLAKLPGSDTFLKTMCGTPTYLAPEVILQGPDAAGYSFQVDAWSVGVIIYSCIANASPFQEDERLPLAQRIATRFPDLELLVEMGCSREAIDFVARFMIHNPAERMTVYDAIQHPWLAVHRQERALSKRQSSLSRIPDPSPSSTNGSQPRRKPVPSGRQLTTVTSSRVTPPPQSQQQQQQQQQAGPAPREPLDYTAPDSAHAPASVWSSMGSLSRSHTMTDDENSDVVSEAPSYSQRLQRLRIESDFGDNMNGQDQQYQEPMVIQDSQESSNNASKASLLDADDFPDLTPPGRDAPNGNGIALDSTVYSQAGIKRKLPTSAFSSDESMLSARNGSIQSAPNGSMQQSTGSGTNQSGPVKSQMSASKESVQNTGSVNDAADNRAVVQPEQMNDTQGQEPVNGSLFGRMELSNNVIATDYAPRERQASPASSDSSLSPLEDSPPKKTPKSAPLKAKSTNSNGRRSGSSSPRTVKAAFQGPARRSTRLSAAHTQPTNYAESESDDDKPPSSAPSSNARTRGRARKQMRLSAQPSG